MGMIVQHNMASINTNRQLGITTDLSSKITEKLASGYRINRAADDAAGLAISEKMRSQIRGLDQASTNATDGISLIQTAEGALGETHSILQRMRELAIQAANGTETDDDRNNIQDEVEQLQEEINRIATDTEFNKMHLLDGSLGSGGNITSAGPKFGNYDRDLMAYITSDVGGVFVKTSASATLGGESAIWDSTGKVLTLNLADKATYTQAEIDNLIAQAKQEDSTATNAPAEVTVRFRNGSYTVDGDTDGTNSSSNGNAGGTEAGVKAKIDNVQLVADNSGVFVGANKISLTNKRYGKDEVCIHTFTFDAKPGEESCEVEIPLVIESTGDISDVGNGMATHFSVHLASGKEYTEKDIEKILAAGGLYVDVKLSGPNPDEPNTLFITDGTATINGGAALRLSGGAGLGDDDAWLGDKNYDLQPKVGDGIILQVGANYGQTMSFGIDDMGTLSLGVDGSHVNVATQNGAMNSLDCIDEAIAKVSKQRSLLGAVQNRLEQTISNLDNTAENLQSAESSIRDVDMADAMVTYSKLNILQQAGQSMLAQANQSTQGVLQLIQG